MDLGADLSLPPFLVRPSLYNDDRAIIIVFMAMQLAVALSFLDQSIVATALPVSSPLCRRRADSSRGRGSLSLRPRGYAAGPSLTLYTGRISRPPSIVDARAHGSPRLTFSPRLPFNPSGTSKPQPKVGDMADLSPYDRGRVSDVFGRKYTLLACVTVFWIGSLACAVAQSMVQLIVFRGLVSDLHISKFLRSSHAILPQQHG
jgi:hypothetical protein